MPEKATAATEAASKFRDEFGRLVDEVSKVIVGYRDIIDSVLTCLLCDGHALLEGVPGVGKTLLVNTLARCLELEFSRIQFTPDLMPADVTGTTMILDDEKTGGRCQQFVRGPIFGNIILADEINRATPKTQSALLEAMQERHVTVSRVTHVLAEPFMVLATQNPLEMEGTYPLPEAQMDRFLFKIHFPFPSGREIAEILERTTTTQAPQASRIMGGEQVLAMRRVVREVPVASHVQEYAIRMVLATHPELPDAPEITRNYVRYGSSPRGAQALLLGGKVRALLDGRFALAREDIDAVCHLALRHRLVLNFEGEAANLTPDAVLDEIRHKIR
ncbi:MAG: AAA domain-containing protein [Myxococcales bacterium]|nr:AAA domain-containing protein [Myxococcales bacterium]